MNTLDGRDALVRAWVNYCERWAWRMDRDHRGADSWPAASRALHRAATTYDPAWGVTFLRWLNCNLRGEWADERKRMRRIRRMPPGRLVSLPADLAAPRRGEPDERIGPALDAIGRLPSRQAEAVRRHFLDGASQAAIARERGVLPATVHGAVRDGVRGLRRMLDVTGTGGN